MRSFIYSLVLVVALMAGPAMAGTYAQAYSGTAGVDSTGATAPMPQAMPPAMPANQGSAPSTLPPVFQGANAPVAPTPPTAPQPQAAPTPPAAAPLIPAPTAPTTPGALDASTLPPDPCAAYINSYDAYAVCQDRIQRLQRMKDARTKRAEAAEAARARAEERKAARNAPPPEKKGFQRPGQVEPPAQEPVPVQVVPATTNGAATTPATVPAK